MHLHDANMGFNFDTCWGDGKRTIAFLKQGFQSTKATQVVAV
jgi:hypothetical protein